MCNITDVVLDALVLPVAGAGVQQHTGVAFVWLTQQQQVVTHCSRDVQTWGSGSDSEFQGP